MNMTPQPGLLERIPRFDLLIDNLPVPIFLITPEWKLRYNNAAAEILLGRSQSALKGVNIRQVFPEDSALFDLLLRADMIGSLSVYDISVGTYAQPSRQCDIHIQPRGEDIVVMVYPRGAAELLDKTAEANAAAQSFSGMAAHLAHEIRNPLGGIKGAAQLLAEDIDASSEPLIEIIQEETTRINRIVSDFEAQASGTPPDITAVNIHDVLDQVLRAARAGYAKTLHIDEKYDPSLPEVAADRERLVQALHNLVKNAAEATQKRARNSGAAPRADAKAQIWIVTRYRSGVKRKVAGRVGATNLPVQIRIIDNGTGIAPAMLADIFDPFVTTKSEGTGLGLAVVSRIVKEIGGTIEVSSRPGLTEFCLLLPIYKVGES